jgi:hypothetical protein
MPERTIKRRLQDCDAALASDDGPIFSTVAKLVEALKRSISERTQNAERANCRWYLFGATPTVGHFQPTAQQVCMHVASVDLAVVIAQGCGGESPAP